MQRTLNLKPMNLNKLRKLPTEFLRETHNQHLLADYIICQHDKVSINSWKEDIQDAPEDYTYTLDQFETFIFTLNQL